MKKGFISMSSIATSISKLFIFSLTFLVIFLLFYNVGKASTTVIAEGVGEIIHEKKARARDEALNDAFRRAIEKVIGTYVSSETKTRNMKLIKDEIFLHSQGYITNFEIISEQEQEGVYKVKIKAWVKPVPLKKDLARVINTCGDPKMVVFIRETNLGKVQPFSTIGASLRSYFQDKGFHLVSRVQVKKIKDNLMAKKALEGDMNAATSIANNFAADILITGKAYTEFITQKTVRSTKMYSVKAYTNIRAIITQQAQIVGSFSRTVTEFDLSRNSAGNKALRAISEKVARPLTLKIVDAFCSAPTGPSRSIQLVMKNLKNYSKFISIIDRIKQIREVKAVHQRLFDIPVAKLDMDLTLRVEDFAYKLEKIQEFNLKVTRFTQSKIEVKIIG